MRRRRIIAFSVALATAGATAASGHPQFISSGSNRYLKLTLIGAGAVRIAYTVMVGEVPAAAARRLADKNADGILDEAEQAQAGAALRDAVDAGLVVEADGARRKVTWDRPVTGFSSDARVGPIPFSIDLIGRVEAGGGEHRLRIDDATPLEELAESEIRIEEGPGTRLLAGWLGREDTGKQARFVFQGQKFSLLEDRSVGFRYVDQPGRRRRPWPIAFLGTFAGAGIAVAMAMRARRRKRRAT